MGESDPQEDQYLFLEGEAWETPFKSVFGQSRGRIRFLAMSSMWEASRDDRTCVLQLRGSEKVVGSYRKVVDVGSVSSWENLSEIGKSGDDNNIRY